MNRFTSLCIILCTALNVRAQNIAINADGSRANPNAMLDVKSFDKGLLIPRMSSEQRMKIPNTQGLMVYDINTNSFWYNTGRRWLDMSPALAATGAWQVTGNAGTDNTNFFGTTDNAMLNIRVNNQQSGRIDHTLANTFWGFRSGFSITTGNDNTGIGASALFHNTTGVNNTAVGSNALQFNTGGFHNTAVGRLALMFNITGTHNTSIGAAALSGNTTGIGNTATGADALNNNTEGSFNTVAGRESMFFNGSGYYNTASGFQSLYWNTTGYGNAAYGVFSLRGNTTGHLNTAMGYGALLGSGGFFNTAVGSQALFLNGAGTENTACGSDALFFNGNGNNHGITALGAKTDAFGTGPGVNLTNSTVIGYGATVTASNKVRIGNAAVTVIEGQVPFTFPSDGRFKFSVQEDVKGLDFILQLRPVTYQFDTKKFDEQLQSGRSMVGKNTPQSITGKSDNALDMNAAYDKASSIRRSGFIAQEVEEAAKKTGYNFSGVIKPNNQDGYYTMSYDAFVVPIIKAMQEQQQIIIEQNKKITAQDEKIISQDKKINNLEKELAEIKKMLTSKSSL